MKKNAIIGIFAWLVTALLPFVSTGQQSRSVSEESGFKARQALDRAIKASGGLEAMREVKDITREMKGVRADEGQGLRPVARRSDYYRTEIGAVTNHPKMTSVRDLRNQRAFDHLEDEIVGGQPIKFRSVVDSKAAFTAYYETRVVRMRPQSSIAPSRSAMFRRFPETLLQMAANRQQTLHWIGESVYEGRKQQVISFADSDGAALMLFFDAQTSLLTKVETLGDSPVLGDIANEVVYGDYRQVGKLVLPFRYTDKVGGSVLQDLIASSILLNTSPADDLFRVPEGFSQVENAPPRPVVKKLAEDVYALLGPYNSLFVVFKDYVLAVEAGHSNGYSRAAIEQIKATAPNKPIRYVVSTHFHFDHISGVRTYIAEGTTILTTSDARRVIEESAGRKHVMFPDALSLNPRPAVIEVVSDKRVFDDEAHRVELYQIGPNPHCAEMIVVYLPKEKILFEADMFDLEIPDGAIGVAGNDTADLSAKIKKLGLQVEQIIPAHGRMGVMGELERAISNRAER